MRGESKIMKDNKNYQYFFALNQ